MLSLVFALALALVHVFAATLRFLEGTPRSRWLSLAGGASVAYVFVHLLPELQEAQRLAEERLGEALAVVEHPIYLLALAGLGVFYGLERRAQATRSTAGGHGAAEGPEEPLPDGVFWLHVGTFGLYNAIIGYLLRNGEFHGTAGLVTFFLAMALHFLVNDFGLQRHHRRLYLRRGRWLLAGAVLGGWALAAATPVSELLLGALLAFLGGGVILNVLKEELPEERESRFGAFALGATGYTVLLLLG